MKFIVTHTNPDLDAICSVWLIKRFWCGWEEAEVKFVPAGEVYQPEEKLHTDKVRAFQVCNLEIVHVDTGLGEFDHHQTQEDTCSAKLIFEYMKNVGADLVSARGRPFSEEAVERMIAVVNNIDHFRNVYYPDATADYHDFSLVSILDGLNLLYNNKGEGDRLVVEHGLVCLDAIYKVLENKVKAESEIAKERKNEIKTRWGKVIGFETTNDAVLELAQKMGYQVVVRKDPKKGYVRIKALPDKGIDLTPVCEALKKKDLQATWFLHVSRTMLLNGTTKNPKMRPTKLSLGEIMEAIKST